MKQLILWTGVFVAGTFGAKGTVEDDGRSRVEVVGFQVTKPLAGKELTQSITGRKTGTAVTVKVTHPAKHFLGVDPAASKLVAFTDDRGTELVGESAAMLRTWLDGQTWVSDDGRSCVFDLLAMEVPSRRARQVKVSARVGLKFGRNPMTAEQQRFRLAKDSRLKVGPAPMTITGVQHADKSAIFTLSTKVKPDRIARVRFFNADGKEYATKLLEKHIVGFMGETYYDWTYSLKDDKARRIDSATVRVEYFGKVQTTVIPVEATAGAGL